MCKSKSLNNLTKMQSLETRTREFFEAIGIIRQIFFRLRKDELEIENQRKMKQESSPIINNIYKENKSWA